MASALEGHMLVFCGLACGPPCGSFVVVLWTSLLVSCGLHLELWTVELWSWPGDCSPCALLFSFAFQVSIATQAGVAEVFGRHPCILESLVMYACMVSCSIISLVADCFALVGLLGVLAVEYQPRP